MIDREQNKLTSNLVMEVIGPNHFDLNIVEKMENWNGVQEGSRIEEGKTIYGDIKVENEEFDEITICAQDVTAEETLNDNFVHDNSNDDTEYILPNNDMSDTYVCLKQKVLRNNIFNNVDSVNHLGIIKPRIEALYEVCIETDDAQFHSDVDHVNYPPKLESPFAQISTTEHNKVRTVSLRKDNSVWQKTSQTFSGTSEKINKKRKTKRILRNDTVSSALELMVDKKTALDKLVMKKLKVEHKTRQDLTELEVGEGNINKCNALTEETEQVHEENNYVEFNEFLENRFVCDICNYETNRKHAMDSHLLLHKDTARNIFVCSYCGYITKNHSTLTCHVRLHTGEKPFSCQYCPYKCIQKRYLLRHMMSHTGKKPFSCDSCPYKCINKSDLFKHMRTHTGEKPYFCEYCPYTCVSKSNIITHTRTHTGVKSFSCNHCTYRCIRKSTLIRHIRTHTGEKRFSCKLCNYKCIQKGNLVRHMRRHNGDEQ